jgi:hypothetical protein
MKRFPMYLVILSPVIFALLFAPGAQAGGMSMNAHTPTFPPGRAGYYDTPWPSEHTDLWRSHAAFNAGLPANFDPERLAVSQVGLNLPIWGYTRDRNEVFVIGGQPVALDAYSDAYRNSELLTPAEFLARVVLSTANPSVA